MATYFSNGETGWENVTTWAGPHNSKVTELEAGALPAHMASGLLNILHACA